MKRIPIVLILILTAIASRAQLRLLPIQRPVQDVDASSAQSRVQGIGSITLPLWDDFSTSTGQLDTTWWMPGSQAQVLTRPGNGVLPPTINVVTFDGVDAMGNPYSATASDGPVDSLVSRPIDLTQVPVSLRSSVYLSFFYQVKGLGNPPEPEDSLLLYFKKADGEWQKMWPLAGDNFSQDPTIFTEKFINVPNNPAFFHDDFQFKFQAEGRQNGWFDNWNIDYIYMDKRRNANDNSYLDHAFTDFPSSILNGYTAIPFNEFAFNSDPGAFLSKTSTWIRSLENDTQPVEYSVTITDTLNNTVLATIANLKELILFPRDVKEAISDLPDPSAFDLNADSLFLEIKYFVKTGDKNLIDSIYNAGADTVYYDHIDLRVNDTVRSYVTIHDYFAYDDGSAEFGVGVNQKEGQFAHQFVSKNSQFIDRVDIYFPNISRNQAGSPMEAYIFKELNDVNNTFLGVTSGTIQHNGFNKFVSYNFNTSIHVQDTFYVGFKNLADDGLWTAIGLDLNTNSGDKIYYNINGTWVKNTHIEGSMMLRPHFTDKLVTGTEDLINQLTIYPNPTTDYLTVEGSFDNLTILDLTGRNVPYRMLDYGSSKRLLLDTRNKGIILLVFEVNSQKIVHKVLLAR